MKNKLSINVLFAVLSVGVMTFGGVTVETSMNITFPTLMSEFNVGLGTVQWITTLYLLVLSTIIPLSRFLKNKFKTYNLFLFSNVIFVIGLILDAFSPNFFILLLGRFVQGIGTGIALPLMFNIILDNVPKSKLGFMMGVGSLITASASAIGPAFGGLVVNSLGWRYIFILLIPVLLISLLLGSFSIPKTFQNELHDVKFDYGSFVLIILMFAGLIIGISNISENSLLSYQVLIPIIIGVLALIIFTKMQNKSKNPILKVDILKNVSYAKYTVAFFINQLIILGLAFIVPNYIQIINKSSSSLAGLILLPGAIMGAIMSPISGSLLDRMGAKKPILTGIAMVILSLLVLFTLSSNISDTIFLVAYIIVMIGIGMSYGNLMTQGLSYLSSELTSDGNAILTTVQQFAGAIGTAIISTIITSINSSYSGGNATVGFKFALLFLLILGFIQFLAIISTKINKK
ncbi:MFS transporter [Apilactobacillus ozensis]|uniref:MFS transporter n=1 Tax=Apilactobacillus ozensis TaxID=866801 RepID=UPI00200A8C18|nr:MFS transporter [Apilactobacillus ozensis]MCK8607235.1 MFS transporter [Apilactobacillus ozensis]